MKRKSNPELYDKNGRRLSRPCKTDKAIGAMIDRMTGIGGSDVHHVFSLPPYGCARRLFYEKTNVPPDYPLTSAEANFHIRRGVLFEDMGFRLYKEQTGLDVRRSWSGVRSKQFPYMFAHLDGVIIDKQTRRAQPLEIKSPGKQNFLKIKFEGVPDSWILQLQHYIFVRGADYGAYAIWSPEMAEMLPSHNVERNDPLIKEIIRAEYLFWKQVGDNKIPPRLDITDKRCAVCSWRVTCQGQIGEHLQEQGEYIYVQDKKLADMVASYISVREEIEAQEALKQRLKADIVARCNHDKTLTDKGKVNVVKVNTSRIDVKQLAKDHPDLVAKYIKKSVRKAVLINYPNEREKRQGDDNG